MSKFEKYFLNEPNQSKFRDTYFLEIYDQAFNQAKIKLELKNKTEVGADDVANELVLLLSQEISASDFKPSTLEKLKKSIDDWEPVVKSSDDTELKKALKCGAIQQVLLSYIFKNDEKIPENDALTKWKVNNLMAMCVKHKNYLEGKISKNENQNSSYNKQLESMNKLLNVIDNDGKKRGNESGKLEEFKKVFSLEKDNFKHSNDSNLVTFFKGVLTVLSLGLAVPLGIWKHKGSELNQKIDSVISNNNLINKEEFLSFKKRNEDQKNEISNLKENEKDEESENIKSPNL